MIENISTVTNGQFNVNTGSLTAPEVNPTQEQLQAAELDKILDNVARSIVEYSLQLKPTDKLLIKMGSNSWHLASKVMSLARSLGTEVNLRSVDKRYLYPATKNVLGTVSDVMEGQTDQENIALPKSAEKISPSLFEKDVSAKDKATAFIHHGIVNDEMEDMMWATKVLIIRESDMDTSQLAAEDIYRKTQKEAAKLTGDNSWTLIYTPSEEEARVAGMPLNEYAKMYYEASSRPWKEVEAAQQHLIDILKEAKTITITAGSPPGMDEVWATKVSMNVEGMIPANSGARRNIPGSEVFLAPNAGTIEGHYAVPYPIRLGEKRILDGLAFDLKGGRIVEENGRFKVWILNPKPGDEEYVQQFLHEDDKTGGDGAAIGELGIGTNPVITKAYLNPLLVEKAGGSIHLAVGYAYDEYDTNGYLGQKVKVDNGNRSQHHVDLTRMLTPEYGGGRIAMTRQNGDQVEEVVLQENGVFLDEKLAILNRAQNS